jgi:lauroyl/myristoyl acyltransferase
MKSANSPESKTRKRKVALANLEKQYSVSKSDTSKERIVKEIATLKSRILN